MIELQNRLALSIAEAAQVVGLSENAFRDVLPEIEKTRVGRRVIIPIFAIENWLRDRARNESVQDEALANEMLQAVR